MAIHTIRALRNELDILLCNLNNLRLEPGKLEPKHLLRLRSIKRNTQRGRRAAVWEHAGRDLLGEVLRDDSGRVVEHDSVYTACAGRVVPVAGDLCVQSIDVQSGGVVEVDHYAGTWGICLDAQHGAEGDLIRAVEKVGRVGDQLVLADDEGRHDVDDVEVRFLVCHEVMRRREGTHFRVHVGVEFGRVGSGMWRDLFLSVKDLVACDAQEHGRRDGGCDGGSDHDALHFRGAVCCVQDRCRSLDGGTDELFFEVVGDAVGYGGGAVDDVLDALHRFGVGAIDEDVRDIDEGDVGAIVQLFDRGRSEDFVGAGLVPNCNSGFEAGFESEDQDAKA